MEKQCPETKLCLRAKNQVDPLLTDRQVFEAMPLGDVWEDATLASTYFYLRRGKYLVIPDSWQAAVAEFDRALDERVPSPALVSARLWVQYMSFVYIMYLSSQLR